MPHTDLHLEGEYLETVESIIFAVKGTIHPPHRIVAFPKYIPTPTGSRSKGKKKYMRIGSLKDSYRFLKERHPEYLHHDPNFNELLSEVPHTKVIKYYRPQQTLRRLTGRKAMHLDEVERDAVDLAILLHEHSNIPQQNIGISGSVMAGLHNSNSDIDLIIYGSNACHAAYKGLKKLTMDKASPIKPYNIEGLKRLYRQRRKDTKIPLKDFLKVERRKILQGKFRNRDYFIRMLKAPQEVSERYGDPRYTPMGFIELTAEVNDDTEAIFTPCIYRIKKVSTKKNFDVKKIEEVASFRGRFSEQAKKGERIFVRGKLEMVTSLRRKYYRVLIGNRPEDYLHPISSKLAQ